MKRGDPKATAHETSAAENFQFVRIRSESESASG